MLTALPAAAQDDLDERLAVAREYLGTSIETMDLDAIASQMSVTVLQTIAQRQPALYAAKEARLKEIVERNFADAFRKSMLDIDRGLAETFSLSELTALRDFYASPVGRSVMTKMPAYMAEVMPRIIQASMQDMGPMLEQLRAEGVDLD